MSEEENTGGEVSPAEQEARQFGWVAKEEFQGNPDEWRDADTFLKRGREINGFLRKDLDKIKGQLSAKEVELNELRSAMDEFKQFTRQNIEREYKAKLDILKAEKKQAISEGDGDKVIEIDDAIDSLKDEAAKQVLKPVNDTSTQQKILNAWLDENPVFADPEVMDLVDTLAPGIKAKNPTLVGRDFLEKVAEQVKKLVPSKFDTNSNRPSAVSSSSDSGAGRTGGKKKSYADLPSEAKAACDKFVKQGLMTQAEYIKEYFQGE